MDIAVAGQEQTAIRTSTISRYTKGMQPTHLACFRVGRSVRIACPLHSPTTL